jgi:hypothetical protein
VQRWYFKIKKEAYKQSRTKGVAPSEVEQRALSLMKPEQAKLYEEIVCRLSSSGGPLEEVNEWLKANNPI